MEDTGLHRMHSMQYAVIGVQNSKTAIARMVLNDLTFLYSKSSHSPKTFKLFIPSFLFPDFQSGLRLWTPLCIELCWLSVHLDKMH